MRVLLSTSTLSLAIALAALPAAAAQAQDVAPPPAGPQTTPSPDDQIEEDTIVILARMFDRVETVQPPLLELAAEDIAAYGVGSITELLEALGPQVSSGRGRGGGGGGGFGGGGGGPVVLVNGVRIASMRELGSYPPEAIERVEIFSEEVAQQFGYSPDQRVVNVILKSNYSSRDVEVEYGQPFGGGTSDQEIDATYLRIDGGNRLNLNLEWNNSSPLFESERDIVQATGSQPTLASDPDPAQYRTLVADAAGLEATANWTTKLDAAGTGLSLNATFERDDSLRLQGLDSVVLTSIIPVSLLRTFNDANPLAVNTRSTSYSGGATLTGGLGEWRLTATADGTYATSRSQIDRRANTAALVSAAFAGTLPLTGPLPTPADAGIDRADTDTYTTNTLATASGNMLRVPAGDITATLDAGVRLNGIDSRDTRNPGIETNLSRSRVFGGANLAIPLTSRDEDFGGVVGDLSLNLNAGVDQLSDFGTLYDWSATLTWGVTEALTLSATHINRDEAPTLSQLGSPEIATPNVAVFDLATNQTVLATVISGGNALLPAQNQSDWKIGLVWDLPVLDNASFSADYIRNHSSNVSSGLPTLTPAIEVAFPGRAVRSAGVLVSLDNRPVSFAAQDVERLQFGLNLSGQIGAAAAAATGRGGGATGGPQGGPAAFGGLGGGQGGQAGAGGPGGAGGAGPGGGGRGQFDPARFAQMRAQFCEVDPAAMVALLNQALTAAASGAAPPNGPDGQPLAIPPQMLERLKGADGTIDPAAFGALRERFCNGDGPGAGGGPGAGAQPGGQPGAQSAAPGVTVLPPGAFRFGGGGGGPGGPGGPGGGGPGGQGGPGGGPGGGGGGFRGGFGGGGPGGGQGGAGRWFINLQYTLDLENTVLIAPGVPLLDLLDGDALTGGGQPQHQLSWRAGAFYKGFGLITFINYASSQSLNGSGLPGSTDLEFGDIAKVNLRTFVDFAQQTGLVEDFPLLAKARLGIGINNLFDARQRVTDNSGNVPLRYQPFLLDPVGRSFEIEFRKLF